MVTVTISKKITHGQELVVIPREEYRKFLQWQRVLRPSPRNVKTVKATAAEIKEFKRAQSDYRRGKLITIDELKQRLGLKN